MMSQGPRKKKQTRLKVLSVRREKEKLRSRFRNKRGKARSSKVGSVQKRLELRKSRTGDDLFGFDGGGAGF